MRNELLSIGKMAELNHVTVATLRLYDEKGLLQPHYIDESTGYRYYVVRQTGRLDLIQCLKSLGMSLEEVKRIFDSKDTELIESILVEKDTIIENKIEELNLQKNAISRVIKSVERYRKSPPKGTLSLEYIDKRKIYAIPASINFYDYDLNTYEKVLNGLRNSLREHGLNKIYYYNVGTTVSADDFENGKLIAKDIFIFTYDDLHFDNYNLMLQSGMYACVCLDNYEEETKYAAMLRDYCEINNYKITGDYICEILTELNLFDDDKRNMFLRLQVPISF